MEARTSACRGSKVWQTARYRDEAAIQSTDGMISHGCEGNNEQHCHFLPAGPVQRIIRIFIGLRDEDDAFIRLL